jgi:hypothetical protein
VPCAGCIASGETKSFRSNRVRRRYQLLRNRACDAPSRGCAHDRDQAKAERRLLLSRSSRLHHSRSGTSAVQGVRSHAFHEFLRPERAQADRAHKREKSPDIFAAGQLSVSRLKDLTPLRGPEDVFWYEEGKRDCPSELMRGNRQALSCVGRPHMAQGCRVGRCVKSGSCLRYTGRPADVIGTAVRDPQETSGLAAVSAREGHSRGPSRRRRPG